MLGCEADVILRRILSQWFEAAVPRVHINGPTMMNCLFMSRPSIRLRYDKRTSSGSMTALGLEVAAPPSSAAEPPLSKIQQAMPSGRSSHRLVLIVCCRIFPTYKCLAVSLSFRHSFYMPGLSHCTVFVSSESPFVLFGVEVCFDISSCLPSSELYFNTAYRKDGLDI